MTVARSLVALLRDDVHSRVVFAGLVAVTVGFSAFYGLVKGSWVAGAALLVLYGACFVAGWAHSAWQGRRGR